MAQRSRLSTGLCGIAGEYFVAAELSRRGYVATLTLRNTRGIDILVSNSDATKTVAIQVKTIQGSGDSWTLNKKAEEDTATNLCYVFVRLNDLASPEYHVVPKNVVVQFISTSHRRWLSQPGRGGLARKDTAMRKYVDEENRYRERWDLLGLD